MSSSGGGTPAVPTGPAGGDLSGGYPAPTVSQVQGRPVSAAAPGNSQAFVWNGAFWLPSAVVNNFAGRTGGIVPTTGDYTASQVTNAADKSAVAAQAFTGSVTAPLLGTANGINLATGAAGVVNPCIYYDGNFMYLSTVAGKGVRTPGGGNTLDDGAGNMAVVGALTISGAPVWTAYAPALGGGWVIGNGTLAASYRKIDNKTVAVRISLVTGTTTTVGAGALTLGLPFAAPAGANQVLPCRVTDAVSNWSGVAFVANGAATAQPQAPLSATNPTIQSLTSGHAFGAGSEILVEGIYEAA